MLLSLRRTPLLDFSLLILTTFISRDYLPYYAIESRSQSSGLHGLYTEYRSHLARQRNKIKTLISDDDLSNTLGELLFVRTRFVHQLAFLRHF